MFLLALVHGGMVESLLKGPESGLHALPRNHRPQRILPSAPTVSSHRLQNSLFIIDRSSHLLFLTSFIGCTVLLEFDRPFGIMLLCCHVLRFNGGWD